jgi:thioredoxin 1
VQAPIVDEVATEIGDKMKVVKVEVDESPDTAGKYNILSIPTLVMFKGGEVVWQGVGVHQKPALLDELKKHVE